MKELLGMAFLLLPIEMAEYWYLAFFPTFVGVVLSVYFQSFGLVGYGISVSFLGSYLYIVLATIFRWPL